MKRRTFLRLTLPLAATGMVRAEPSDTPDLLFGVIADPQYADKDPWGTRFYRESLRKLPEAIEALNTFDLKFVVTLGDTIDIKFESFAAIMPLYEKLRAPRRFVFGNHDFDVSDADKLKVSATLGMRSNYSSEVHGKWRFLSLDGTEVAIWRHPADDPRTAAAAEQLKELQATKLPNAQPYNGGMGPGQMAWLANELDKAKAAGQRVILFNHYPVLPAENPHNLWNAAEVVALLAKHDHVAAWFNGHNHAGNYATRDGCHFVNFKGMVETKDTTAFAVVRCFPDRLEIDGHGIEPDRTLA